MDAPGTGKPVDGFPRGRLRRRHMAEIECWLASVQMFIATPMVIAVAAAALAVVAPSREVVRSGVVVGRTSLGQGLIFAAIGAFIGVVGILVVLTLCSVGRYWTRGDPAWKVLWKIAETNDGSSLKRTNGVELSGKRTLSVGTATLGRIEAIVRMPTGEHTLVREEWMVSDTGAAIGFQPIGSMHLHWPRGEYQIRWYGTTARHRQYEVARSKFTFS